MKSKRIAIINLIIAVALCVFTLGHAFAWLANERKTFGQTFNGSSAQAYFAGGSGTEQDPYEINDKYHLYNLAWLQNTGKLARMDGGKYYFELTSNVSLPTDFWLPPIGTEDYPFSSDFNGNGYTVNNLRITTDRSKLTGVSTSNAVAFSNAVGMFGKTAEGSEIHNFILQAPVVEVANANATYQTGANRVAGLAVGHVAVDSKVYSIGVLADSLNAELLVNRAGYTTFNSIIGELAVGADSSVTGGGHVAGDGSGSSFGASFDVKGMYERLEKIEANAGASSALPGLTTSSDSLTLAKGEKMPFTVTNASTYEGADAAEVIAKTNVGYFLGNQNKFYTKHIEFCDPLKYDSTWEPYYISKETTTDETTGKEVTTYITPETTKTVPRTFYTQTGGWQNSHYKEGFGFAPITEEQYASLPSDILALIPDENIEVDYNVLRVQAEYTQYSSVPNYGTLDGSSWSYHGKISWLGNEYGSNSEDGTVSPSDSNGVALPNNGVWFKPATVGKFKFVMYADKDNENFCLLKVVRNDATKDNPFANGQTTVTKIMQHFLPPFVMFYFEYEVTQEDIDAGNVEYVIMMDNNASESTANGSGGAFLLYLDIGASAEEDSYTIDRNKAVSAVDFIYDGVSIAQADDVAETPAYSTGDFIVQASGVLYEATATSVYFEQLNTVLKIAYMRKSLGEEQTLEVAVSGTLDTSLVLATKVDKVEFTFSET